MITVLVIGDIVGSPGRKICQELIGDLRREYKADFVIANAENAAAGSGITSQIAQDLFYSSIDVITTGNHVWRRKEVFDMLETEKRLLRPLNYPEGTIGRGSGIYATDKGIPVGVINLQGRVFMPAMVECPLKVGLQAIEELRKTTPIIIVDIHAEATSEKIAFTRHVTPLPSLVFGTHTHVQTADEEILHDHTAYISDIGMTGPFDSIIGRETEQILKRFLSQIPCRADVATGDLRLNGIAVSIDEKNGKALSIQRIQKRL